VEPDETTATLATDPAPAADAPSTEVPWTAVLMLVGEETTDGRIFEPGGMTVRDLPLSLWYLPTNPHGGMFDEPGKLAGRIDTVELVGNQLRGTGVIDTSLEAGDAPVTAIRSQAMRWLSADNGASAYEVEERGCEDCDWETGEGCDTCVTILHFTEWEFMGATILGIPAFPQAVITLDDNLDAAVQEGLSVGEELLASLGVRRPCCADCAQRDALSASAGPVDLNSPPAEWFANPMLGEATPLTVTPEGRVFGHLAAWNTCHTGYPNECVLAPRSRTDYAFFRTGSVLCDNGESVRVGQLTIGSGHAPLSATHRAAADHYDNAARAWADVACGEDEHGIWIAGATRAGLDEATLRAARASALSGDWRAIGGNLEMLAALSVNAPGFPVVNLAASAGEATITHINPRARVSDGTTLALVAAGMVQAKDPVAELRKDLTKRIEQVESVLRALRPTAAANLAARMGA
jgi:hypothetical protein